jgi:acetyl-CoA synthetase
MDDDRRLIHEIGEWDEMRARFRWRIPPAFNIAEACSASWARAEPGRTALIHVGDGEVARWSYGALDEAAARFAGALGATGIGRGDRVAVLLSQSPETLIAHLGALRLGAVSLPLFTLFGEDALAFRLRDSGARAAVTDAANLDRLLALDTPDLQAVWCTGPGRARSFSEDIQTARPARMAPTAADDPAMLIYTSGTTGSPKGALHAHRFLLGHLPAMELHHEGFPRPGDVGWTPADWAWIGGLMDMAMPCLYHGVPLVSRRFPKFDPEAAWRLVADQGLRNLFLPPTALKLMRQAAVPKGVRVRSISSGGESLGDDLREWGRTALGAPVNEIYGQTECNLVVCSTAASQRPGAMGRAVPGHEVAIIAPDGTPSADGDTGEIAVARPDPVMFLGYWNQPEKTDEKFAGRWLRTGDLGRRDADGFFSYVARDDDVITSSGYRIGPSEIEHCLMGHPNVVMAAVVGVPDPERTEIVVAYVVLSGAAEPHDLETDLIDRVRRKVGPYLAPKRIVRVTELPMTPTGKVLRRELRDRG